MSDPQPEHIMQFFKYGHLPDGNTRKCSAMFAQIAEVVVSTIPRSPERTVCLRKLLEAKDAGVRAVLCGG